jgi:hypothetical protein
MKHLRIGNHVSWHCAAGHLTGKITDIFLKLNGREDLVPWIIIDGRDVLCATESNLIMMKVQKIETRVEV